MELYLVKNKVKITEVPEAFSKTKDFNEYVSRLERRHNMSGFDEEGEEESQEEDDRDRMLLKMSHFPVTLKSICSDDSEHSEKFAKRVERKLLTKDSDKFGKIAFELILSDRSNSLDGYFLISGLPDVDESSIDILAKMKDEFNELDEYGGDALEFMTEVSLGHLPTASAACSPGPLITLKRGGMDFRTHQNQVRNQYSIGVRREIKEWCERGTGFIYAKLSVKVTLKAEAVNLVYGSSDVNHKFLQDGFEDVQISCKNGEVVKCHRNILADKSSVFEEKFKEMEKEGKGGSWKFVMEMSKESVEAFVKYIYCGYVSGGLDCSDVGLELLKAGSEYELWGLSKAMKEIITAKRSTDFKYFSVKGALDLFMYARNVEDLKHLRDKAIRVLRNYLKTAKDETLASQEYQDLLKDPVLATELSTLYAQLK